MLQKSNRRSKTKDHISHLERRLELWKEGSFDDLLKEGCAIQKCLTRGGPRHNSLKGLNKYFSHLMFEGRTRVDFRLLDQANSGGQLLSLDSPIPQSDGTSCTTREVLFQKHPSPGRISPDHVLLKTTPSCDHDTHFAVLDQLDSTLIKRTVLRIQGAAG